jgi:crotonobetainyl-CoA:carnitine CoA-transferase CaiB-like acyl-CoA transferase
LPDTRPLAGLRLLDLTSNIAGPFATLVLADLGAEVIKIERPGRGDDSRHMAPFASELSSAFEAVNRGKRSVALDIRTPEGRDAVLALARTADVLVESMRPGKMAELGLGADDIAGVAPDLVYCSLSGYGATGPEAARPGYDMLMQARTGIMTITGEQERAPVRVGPSIVDIGTGIWTALGVVTSLLQRLRHPANAARPLDVSLFDAGVAWMTLPVTQYAFSGREPTRMGGQTPIAAPADIYPTADGYVVVSILNDAIWERFLDLTGRPATLSQERFARNEGRVRHRAELTQAMSDLLRQRSSADWVEQVQRHGVTLEPLQQPSELLGDPQALARGMIRQVEHPQLGSIPQVATPLQNSGFGTTPESTVAPTLGQDTRAVLGSAGLDEAAIDVLVARGLAADSAGSPAPMGTR